MKYILTQTDSTILGPFTTVEQVSNGYMCDGDSYQTTATGPVTLSEVADDYVNPQVQALQNEAYNAKQSTLRAEAYPTESDPVFFQYQRGVKTQQEWLDAVAAVQAQYPYKQQV